MSMLEGITQSIKEMKIKGLFLPLLANMFYTLGIGQITLLSIACKDEHSLTALKTLLAMEPNKEAMLEALSKQDLPEKGFIAKHSLTNFVYQLKTVKKYASYDETLLACFDEKTIDIATIAEKVLTDYVYTS